MKLPLLVDDAAAIGPAHDETALGDFGKERESMAFLAKASRSGSSLFHSCRSAIAFRDRSSRSAVVAGAVLQPRAAVTRIDATLVHVRVGNVMIGPPLESERSA